MTTMKKQYRFLAALALMITGLALSGQNPSGSLLQDLERAAPSAKREVIRLAVEALECATSSGQAAPKRLAGIDYSLPSTPPPLLVFSL